MKNADEWSKLHYELDFDDQLFDAANTAASLISSPRVSPPPSSGNNGGLFPKGTIGKPIRRQSRASKKAPTTLLNANADNFRALVQQFTGCRSSSTAFGAYKGPITLNFSQYNYSGEAHRPEGRRREDNLNLHGEVDQSFFSFNTDSISGKTTTTTPDVTTNTDRQLFDSTFDYHSRSSYPLTLDDFVIENLSLQELSGPGDYSALPGTKKSDDNIWGF